MGVRILPHTHATAAAYALPISPPDKSVSSASIAQAAITAEFHRIPWLAEQVAFSPPSQRVGLVGPIAPGWVLLQPLLLTMEQDDGYWIVSDDEFFVYGDGHTADAALDDYILSLIDYYQLLRKSVQDNLEDRAPFNHIRQYLRPTPLH